MIMSVRGSLRLRTRLFGRDTRDVLNISLSFRKFAPQFVTGHRHFATATTRTPSPSPRSRSRWPYPLGLSLAILPGLYYWFIPPKCQLSPQLYSEHPISSTARISPQHAMISVDIPPVALSLFGDQAVRRDGTPIGRENGEVVVQHCYMMNPFIQIERPYTPINDPEQDGKVTMVVKRVKGGEVGRLVHSLKQGEDIGIRGPITTFTINPNDYDKIVMISTGTGVAPFLQLLSKVANAKLTESPPTQYHLLLSQPSPEKEDWVVTSGLLPSLQQRLGARLTVDRPSPGYLQRDVVAQALAPKEKSSAERVMVLICLPPPLLRPLAGSMTPHLDQGPLTGFLADIGLKPEQVWKLE